MFQASKIKSSSKKKEKLCKISIEDGIPEAPRLSDFETNYEKDSAAKKDSTLIKESSKETQNLCSDDYAEKEVTFLCSNINTGHELSSSDAIQNEEEIVAEESSCTSQTKPLNSIDINNDSSNNECSNVFKMSTADENCSLDVYNYSHLSKTVKLFTEEMQEASAPTDKTLVITENVSMKNTYLFNENIENKDLNKYNFTLVLKDFLEPFTDEKLSDFYFNPKLQESKNYVDEFIHKKIYDTPKKNNYFYELLMEYVQSRNNLKKNEKKVKDLKKRISNCISTMWTVWNNIEIKATEICEDGNSVAFVQKCTQAQFNTNIYDEFVYLLKEIKYVIFEAFTHDVFVCSFLKLKIEYYLQHLLTSCPEFTNLETESAVTIKSPVQNTYSLQCKVHLKQIISVLFFFQKQQSFDIDSGFIEESRQWLTDLVSVLVRVGDWKDHIFLLNHILRCPGGVSEWAASFVQLPHSNLPVDPFKNDQINHIMAALQIFLSPINHEEIDSSDKEETEINGNDSNPWTVVDSDGEIEGDTNQKICVLKENDLVSILNQIPFSYLFKTIFYHQNAGNAKGFVSSEYLLKIFSLSTDFIKILLSGLKLYKLKRYKQFSKRLGRLICHAVHYATYALITYKSQNPPEDEMKRIQAEYDNFFLRATKFIYSAKKHGSWQFLAIMPYHEASSLAILKLYALLQLNDNPDEYFVNVNFSNFEEKFLQLPGEEQCYLLTTFANMALARDVIEMQFIKNVLLQLFFIGFSSSQTMENSYKNVQDLLCNICCSHHFLISDLLKMQNQIFLSDPLNEERISVHLWLRLPLELWKPNKIDLEILSRWLLEPSQNLRYELARIILQSLNYGISQGELFLDLNTHQAVAMMLMKGSYKLSNENEQGFMKNVSNLVRSQNMEQSVNNWTWNILMKLRLHLLDKTEASLYKYFNHSAEYLKCVPEVESNIDLHHLVLKKYPIACFIALMTTTLGHSVPIIFEKGFDLVEILFNDGKYDAGIACLEFMIFAFLESNECLPNNEKFIVLLSQMIAADNTYVQIAKNLVSNNFPGPVLRSLECMIQNQLNFCRSLDFSKFGDCIKLWLISLTKLPLWTQEIGILYLLDKLLKNAFFDYTATKMATSIFENLIEEIGKSPSETKSSFLSLAGWLNSKSCSSPTLLPKGFDGEVPWLSYLIIQIEFEKNERQNFLWLELLKELHSSADKKTDVDGSLKKVCNFLGFPPRPASSLAIYKWSNQILKTDLFHPLIPLLWQKFFSLYFFRIPGQNDRGSVGEKFFDGVLNRRLFKQLDQRLTDTCNHFKRLTDEEESEKVDNYFSKCHQLFRGYSLWMSDSRLEGPYLNTLALPTEYNGQLLRFIIHGDETPWLDFLELEKVERNFKEVGSNWAILKNRSKKEKSSKAMSNIKLEKSKDKIKDMLNSYESPLPPPSVNTRKYFQPTVGLNVLTSFEETIRFIEPLLGKLLNFKKAHGISSKENSFLSGEMEKLCSSLYDNSEINKILRNHCGGTKKSINGKSLHYPCSGPAVANLKYEESILNEEVYQKLNRCEKKFFDNVRNNSSEPPSDLSYSTAIIDIAIEELKKEFHAESNRKDPNYELIRKLKETGVNLFYELIRNWYEKMAVAPHLKTAFDRYIHVLGKTFVENNSEENENLLRLMLSNDENCGGKLMNYFTPNSSAINDFVAYYSSVVKSSSVKKFEILSRFDLMRFLRENEPNFSTRSCLISSVSRGLASIGPKAEENHNLLKLLNEHLGILLRYDFPEHYGEVLNFLLEGSGNQCIPSGTWDTFLNSLTQGRNEEDLKMIKNETGRSVKKLKSHFTKFASEQRIPLDVIKGTMMLLGSHFKNERRNSGIYGLFGKYHDYTEPIFIFFGMLSYSFARKTLEFDGGSLSEKIIKQIWPVMNDLYSPWLIPYHNGKEVLTPEEQDGGGDVGLPWSTNDSIEASFCASVYSESIQFLLETLPGTNNLLSHVWFFYVNNFARGFVKDYVLNVVHENLSSLSWETFFPSLQDVELMLKVVSQFLPVSHSFLASIFVRINWFESVRYYSNLGDDEIAAKLHICLLHLLVKLPFEPSLKQNEKVMTLLNNANEFSWNLVDSYNYDIVLNWFIMSCDPRIILMDERLEYYALDSAIFRLLQTCAGYIPSAKLFHPTTLNKRVMFVRACIKWMIASNRKFKSKDSPLFKASVSTMLDLMDSVITETTPAALRLEEAACLLCEFSVIFEDPNLTFLVEDILFDWLSKRQSQLIVFGLLRSACATMKNPNLYGRIVENSLENYFSFVANCNWSEATTILGQFPKSNDQLLKILVDNKHFLTLYAILMQKVTGNENLNSSRLILTDVLHLLAEVKPCVSSEPKLLLLLAFCLKLIDSETRLNRNEGISFLMRFYAILNPVIDEGTGFLTAVGLKKPSFSNKFKLICLGVCSGVILITKKNYPDCLQIKDDKILETLNSAESNKIYKSISQYASYSKSIIREISTMEEIVKFVKDMGMKLFNTLYLR